MPAPVAGMMPAPVPNPTKEQMPASVKWQGLAELHAALRALPDDLTAEGSEIVLASAQEAARAVTAAYEAHSDSGDLASKVTVDVRNRSRHGTGVEVKSRAKHAFLFEIGTQGKIRYFNGASRGAMPPAKIFVPTMERKRRLMYSQLSDLLRRHGLTVTGTA